MGQFLPPDHSKGDEHTIGGYAAVHARPAAFEGPDGAAYSVEIETDETGDVSAPVGAFLLFVRWSPGAPHVSGHIETDFLARGMSESDVRAQVGAMTLEQVKTLLDGIVRERSGPRGRPWWEAMQEPEEE